MGIYLQPPPTALPTACPFNAGGLRRSVGIAIGFAIGIAAAF